jgi:hypothetical protein
VKENLIFKYNYMIEIKKVKKFNKNKIKSVNKGLDESKCLEFVTRDKFKDVLDNPDKYEDWYVGYVQCLWSFGNTQTAYLFGKDTEPYKKAGHELVVNCNPELILKLIPNLPQKYIEGIIKQKDWHLRRMALMKVTKALKTRIFELEQLQQLERLQQLEQLEPVKLYSGDYRDVEIPDWAVIYCDPPYKGTTEYKEGGFDHANFWDWVRIKSKTHKVYVSEYQAPDDFEVILSFEQKSTLQGGSQQHDNQPKESLFRIKKEKYEN